MFYSCKSLISLDLINFNKWEVGHPNKNEAKSSKDRYDNDI